MTARLGETDDAITTAVCARLLFKMKSVCALFSPSPSLRHAAPRNRRRAIVFPSVIFNEGSAFIYGQWEVGVRPTKRREKKCLFFFRNNSNVRGQGVELEKLKRNKTGGSRSRSSRLFNSVSPCQPAAHRSFCVST